MTDYINHRHADAAKESEVKVNWSYWILAAIPAVIFVILAAMVVTGHNAPFDIPILNALHAFASPGLDTVVSTLTNGGDAVLVALAAIAIAAWLAYRGRRIDALRLLAGVGGAMLINPVIKHLVERQRPELWHQVVVEHSYSFPSGHAMASSALALSLILLAWPGRWRWWTLTAGVLYMLLIGLSRNYLGVHFPSDILAAWCVSWTWVLIIFHIPFDRLKFDI